MKIVITINSKEMADSVKAVGAHDLLNHFLPSIGVKPDKVSIIEQTDNPMFTYMDTAPTTPDEVGKNA